MGVLNVRAVKRGIIAGTALAMVTVLAACGSDSGSGSSSTAATTAAATSASSAASSATSAATSEGSASASSGAVTVDTSTLNLLTPGTLTVGMNLQFEPEMYLDDAGQPAGYDVDLLNALATELGLTLDIQNLDFNGLIPGLQSKKFDMVSVGLTATDERKKVVDFSREYVPYTSVLAVKNDDTTAPTIENYNQSGKVITALQGSSGEQLAKDTFPNATVSGFPDQNAALLEVSTGRAQGSVLEDYILAQYQKANPDQVKKADLPEPLQIGYGSWAVQKGNTALVDVLNTFLCTQQTDGGLAAFYEKNFEVPAADFPEMPAC
ncbi:transporter substrate-binding domain-containing protein [Nakamurella sp. YIM 132087]|uniref:Transporter substrate-binding domain-containing protein n=1 Tax=Nakamurella alba TaxID=2665158 RepID=A0A7K1FM14_9ACTN|nr:transporter substrate-binding domain-containing protein [Nakamurella alba]MTD15100.1 transporter substrate-binding domain-containing protein [Nakamurella alba]